MSETDYLSIAHSAIESAKSHGADGADALVVASTDLAVSQRMGKPEETERAESSGLGLRVFVGTKTASVSTTDMSKRAIEEACARAVAMAKASLEDPYVMLADEPLWAKDVPDLGIDAAGEPDVAWMREQCAAMEDVALATKGITNSQGADAQVSRSRIALATSKGFAATYGSSSASLSVTVLAGNGDKMERDYAFSMARHIDDLQAATAIGELAAKRALQRLNPKKMPTQQVPVVFDPRVGRSLLASFAGAISGTSVARGTSFLKQRMGEELFPQTISIIDDPHRHRGIGSKPFDAEGVQNARRAVIDKGRLQSWLLDTRSAAQLGLQTTGHAVRGLGSPPYPSATNFYLEAGRKTPQELIADIDNGFYVTDAFGSGVNGVTGDYSQGASGLWIEKGELTFAVSELTIAGHACDMFATLEAANDLVFETSVNTPTLRIDKLMVAGA